jgi:hypothetical protein
MTYQIGYYDAASESWRFFRQDGEIVSFPTQAKAEQVAQKLSQTADRHSREVCVLTIHAVFKTVTEYPKAKPIHHTERVSLPWESPRPVVQCDQCGAKPGWLNDQQRSQIVGEVCNQYGCYGILRAVEVGEVAPDPAR